MLGERARGDTHIASLTPPQMHGRAFSPLLVLLLLAGCDSSGPTGPVIPDPPSGFARFIDISAGDWSACGLTADSLTYCWGFDQVEGGGLSGRPRLVPVPKLGEIALGPHDEFGNHDMLCGKTATDVICRGNAQGGVDTIPGSSGFRELTVGGAACALTEDGGGTCWRYTTLPGHLGSISTGLVPGGTPVDVDGGRTYRSIEAGDPGACALTDAGEAWCWGMNYALQFGDISAGTVVETPRRIDTSVPFASISIGHWRSCALTPAGKAYCWGYAEDGGLGAIPPWTDDCPGMDGTARCVPEPLEVAGGRTFTEIAVGRVHTCAIETGGAVWCWGDGYWGQTGTGRSGAEGRAAEPERVAGNLRFRRIAAGLFFTCAIAENDATYCWGRDMSGELGIEAEIGYVGKVPHPILAP